MEMRTIAQRLAFAESRVRYGDVRVKKQRDLVTLLERHNLCNLHARSLLRELELVQTYFVADRDRLKAEMALSAVSPALVRVEEQAVAAH